MHIGTVVFNKEDLELNRKLGGLVIPETVKVGVFCHLETLEVDGVEVYKLGNPRGNNTEDMSVFCKGTSFTFNEEETAKIAARLEKEAELIDVSQEPLQEAIEVVEEIVDAEIVPE